METKLRVCPNCEDEFYWPPGITPTELLTCKRCYVTLPWDLFDEPQNYVTKADIIRHQRGQVRKAREFFDEQRRRRTAAG